MPLLSIVNLAKKSAKRGTPKSKKSNTTSKKSTTSQAEFPVPAYQFSVEMGDETIAFFQSVSGLSVQRKVDPIPEGGRNDFTQEFPGRINYGHVTLEVGLTSSKMFWEWMMQGQSDGMVSKKDFFLVQRQPNPKSGTPSFTEAKRWSFHQAFPVSWKLSSLSADTTQKIAIETLELSFQYFELQG